MKPIKLVIFFLLVIFSPLLFNYEEHAFALNTDHNIHLDFKDSHISLAAKDTSLLSIIETISAETGIAIKMIGDLPVNPVTINFTDLTIEEALHRLLYIYAENYIIYLDAPKSISLILVDDRYNSGNISLQESYVSKKISGEELSVDALNAIIELGNPADYLPLIMSALKQNDAAIRVNAVKALGAIASQDVIDVIGRELMDGDPEVRYAAIVELSQKNDIKALNYLGAAMNDSDPNIRKHAFEVLVFREDRDAKQIIEKAVSSEHSDIRELAINFIQAAN